MIARFSILDEAGAKELTHKDIASYIYQKLLFITLVEPDDNGNIRAGTWIEKRTRWLNMNNIKIRKARQDKSITATWIDGKTTLEVNFYMKGNSRSQVVVQHSKIVIIEEAVSMKLYWKKSLQRLASMSE